MSQFPAEELSLELLEIHLVKIDTMLQLGDQQEFEVAPLQHNSQQRFWWGNH